MNKVYGVIGDPIAHSMSPLMHNDLFEHYNIDATYLPFHVTKEDLPNAIKGFKTMDAGGFNVTVPHKTAIMPFLDEIDPLAQAIGAVNTVVKDNGRLIGYNTDGSGFLEGLKKEEPNFKDKKMLLIGAGGAARAIYFTMAHAGLKNIDITNRTVENAEFLVSNCPYPVQSNVLNYEEAQSRLNEYDLIVQTTSIGMEPNINDTPICLDGIKEDILVVDIIYTPLETKFLTNAKQNGARIQNGLSMFVYQGALAFEKWTGISPDIEQMTSVVLNRLKFGGTTC